MESCQADKVLRMIESHETFSAIGVNIDIDREKFDQSLYTNIPEGSVLVIFNIPRGLEMHIFYGELYKTLCEGSVRGGNKEK